jgi:hypothetical protein
MFRKRPSSGKQALTERVRQLGERPTPPTDDARSSPVRGGKPREPRRAIFKNGTVMFGTGVRLSVVIKDLTDSGARIEFFARTMLPDEVILAEPMLKLRRRARVAWQRDGAAGLQFLDD